MLEITRGLSRRRAFLRGLLVWKLGIRNAAAILVVTFVWGGLAGAEPPSTDKNPPEGRLASEILTGLEDVYSVRAKLRFQADILGKKWSGRGTYAEVRSGPVPKSRLEIRSGLNGVDKRLLQVCDGKTIWLHDAVENAGRVVTVDATRCQEGVKATGSYPSIASLGAGGVFGLLHGLESLFYFDSRRELPEESGQKWQVTGTLRRGAAARFLGDRAKKAEGATPYGKSDRSHWSRLPGQIPTHVVLQFEENSPIPVAIEYYRMPPNSAGSRLLVGVKLEEVAVNKPIPGDRFKFTPPEGVEVIDRTDTVLGGL